MKAISLFLFLLCTSSAASAQAIFYEDDPAVADHRFMVVDKISDADLVVFRVGAYVEAAGNTGLWFNCSVESRSHFKLSEVKDPKQAEFKVFYTDNREEAGWRNGKKASLLVKK